MFSKIWTMKSTEEYWNSTDNLYELIEQAEAIVIGAGSGLSTAAGFTYSGERFQQYFSDFIQAYGFKDMYSGGFYPFETLEEYWGYWSRYIYINRYMDTPIPVYDSLFFLVKNKDCFVLTTNVDHCFQKAGFDKQRLFYTQGDYGLFQCSVPCHQSTYDNKEIILQMMKEQNNRKIPSDLVPHCPKCGRPLTMNLRIDHTFVEDDGWHRAQERYTGFLEKHRRSKVVFMELGVGANTPGIIKYPFWRFTYENPKAFFVSVNKMNMPVQKEIQSRSIQLMGKIEDIIIS